MKLKKFRTATLATSSRSSSTRSPAAARPSILTSPRSPTRPTQKNHLHHLPHLIRLHFPPPRCRRLPRRVLLRQKTYIWNLRHQHQQRQHQRRQHRQKTSQFRRSPFLHQQRLLNLILTSHQIDVTSFQKHIRRGEDPGRLQNAEQPWTGQKRSRSTPYDLEAVHLDVVLTTDTKFTRPRPTALGTWRSTSRSTSRRTTGQE